MREAQSRRVGRRSFLRGAAAAAGAAIAAPSIVPGAVLGASSPANRVAVGCIGVGRMGRGDMRSLLGRDDVQIVAVCDVDARRAEDARRIVEGHYAGRARSGRYRRCDAYGDFRDLVARPDIDAVTVGTPDHWHALPALASARAGKDIFIQKPLTRTVVEGRVLSDTVRRYGRVLQVGSQQRSDPRFRFACELVRNGRIGRLETVRVGLPTDPSTGPQPGMPVPEGLDYETWLGPAPWKPYTEKRVHPTRGYGRPGWLRIRDYGCGMITGWGSHHLDIAQWGMGTEHTGPVAVEGWGEFPDDGLWDVHGRCRIEYTYASGVRLICADNGTNAQGVRFEGTEGWIYINRGRLEAEPASLLKETFGPDEVHLYRSRDHKGNWIEGIKTRAETVAPVEVGHRSCSVCLVGHVAMRLGRWLTWDPETEQFPGDAEANRMLSRPMREPWTL